MLGQSPLCPNRALTQLLQHLTGTSNDPLFSVSRSYGAVRLTDSVVRRHLHSVSQKLEVVPPLKFHDFRHSVATWAFNNGVPFRIH